MFQRHGTKVVAGAQAAIRFDQEFRRDEQRYALHARRRVGSARQHHMDDIVGDVVIAPRDEYLLTEQPVMTVLSLGPGAHLRQVRTGLRLGQVHRAGPFAA